MDTLWRSSFRLWTIEILTLVVLFLVNKTSLAAEGDVLLQFYMNQVNLWNQQNQQGKLQAAILPGLRAYCGKAENFNACGINATLSVDFTASNIVISPGYPRNVKNRYLDVGIKIAYVAGSNSVTLSKAAVTEITQNQRDHVSSQVGYHLFYINDIMYLPPPPTMANKVLVPLFVLSTLVLIIVALVLKNANDRKRRKHLLKRIGDNEMQPPQQQTKTSHAGNKVGASTTNLETGGSLENKAKTEKTGLDDSRKNKKKKKRSGGHAGDARTGKGGVKRGAKGEFNNIGFNKSINEGDPRNRGQPSELANGGGGSDSSHGGNPRASQSALSEVIQVRSDSPEPGEAAGKSKKSPAVKARGKHPSSSGDGAPGKNKSLSMSNYKKDAEEVMLIDEGVFKPPEANVTTEQSGSDIDDVPTLNDSSDQQMI